MKKESDERFPRRLRIRKRSNYLEVQNNGFKVTSRGFIGLILMRKSGPAKLGIITTKRYGNAPERNRIRRLIKEAFRRGWINLPDQMDFVVIPKKNVRKFDSKSIFDDLGALGKRARKTV